MNSPETCAPKGCASATRPGLRATLLNRLFRRRGRSTPPAAKPWLATAALSSRESFGTVHLETQLRVHADSREEAVREACATLDYELPGYRVESLKVS
jgi:hypothetical protein